MYLPKIHDILQATAKWTAGTERDPKELAVLLDPHGLTVDDWPQWVADVDALILHGRRAAEFTVAYGFPPDQSERTRTALSLVVPYATALRVKQGYEVARLMAGGMPDAILLSTYGVTDPVKYQSELAARRAIGG